MEQQLVMVQMFQETMVMVMNMDDPMMKMKILKKKQSLQERDIRDIFSLQWMKSAMWKISQTFTMDMQCKVEVTLKLMKMEFLQRDQGQEHQMMMKYHNRRQCQNPLRSRWLGALHKIQLKT